MLYLSRNTEANETRWKKLKLTPHFSLFSSLAARVSLWYLGGNRQQVLSTTQEPCTCVCVCVGTCAFVYLLPCKLIRVSWWTFTLKRWREKEGRGSNGVPSDSRWMMRLGRPLAAFPSLTFVTIMMKSLIPWLQSNLCQFTLLELHPTTTVAAEIYGTGSSQLFQFWKWRYSCLNHQWEDSWWGHGRTIV